MQASINHILSELKDFYPETEIRSFSFLIIEKLTGFSRTEVFINKNTLFSDKQRHIINSFIERLKKQEPIQYILGETEFYGLPFQVNESVLIPRPETEELVDWIKRENNRNGEINILDIGTGSGCIAISLKSELPTSSVDAFDISEKALETARSNAELNNQEVQFSIVDILSEPVFDKKWDVIVSNPPYIPELEKAEILPNVLEHEPHLALFVPTNDPLLFYRNIAVFAQKQLNSNGKLYFEIHRDYGKECVELLQSLNYTEVELKKDISGNNRMLKGIKR